MKKRKRRVVSEPVDFQSSSHPSILYRTPDTPRTEPVNTVGTDDVSTEVSTLENILM